MSQGQSLMLNSIVIVIVIVNVIVRVNVIVIVPASDAWPEIL